MNQDLISAQIRTKWAGKELQYFDIVDSTNNIADEAGLKGAASGFLAVADRQDSGRGRRGRTWISPAGYNIFMSIMVRPGIPMDKVSGLTLVMALAVAKAIDKELGTVSCGIKWPNDVVLNKRKIVGILTELHTMPGAEDYYVVIGTGINVNQPADLFDEKIRDIAGSVFSETGRELDRSKLLGECMEIFEGLYEKYIQSGDMSLIKKEYESILLNKDAGVRILDPKGEYEAVSRGIAESFPMEPQRLSTPVRSV